MFPAVQGDQGDVGSRALVLVSGGDDVKRAGDLVLDDPGPAGTLDTHHLVGGFSNQVFQRAVVLVDLLSQVGVSRRSLTTALSSGSQVLPEQAVIDVTTTVEVDGLLQVNDLGDFTLALGFGSLFNGSVVTLNVVGLVEVQVEVHDFFRDVRFQAVQGVVKFRQGDLSSDTADERAGEGFRGDTDSVSQGKHIGNGIYSKSSENCLL